VPHTVPRCLKRILVIDDNPDLAESLSILFGMDGHCVETALTGLEGLEKASSFNPQVVVCDLGMPHFDGLAVAKALRCQPHLNGIRLIALSAYELGQEALAAGFDHYLRKPPNLRELAKLIAD